MCSLARLISLVAALTVLSTVEAQSIDFSPDSGFHPPPLESANIAFYAILFLATLVQIICTVTYLFRGRSPHLLPAVGALVAFLFLAIEWLLETVLTILTYAFNMDGDSIIRGQIFVNLNMSALLFSGWKEAAGLAAVALVLRDRYRTFIKQTTSTAERPLSILWFTLPMWLLVALVFITSSASAGIYGAASTTYNNEIVDAFRPRDQDRLENQLVAKMQMSDRFSHAYVAFVFITTLFLLAFAVVVKMRVKGDKITSITIFGIVPLLCLLALSRLIFEILNFRLPLRPNFTPNVGYALDLSSTIVDGVLHFLVVCLLLHFFMRPRLWDGPGEQMSSQYGSYPPQQFYPPGGMQPIAQFPGQWGYPGQPQGYTTHNVHPDTNYYPNQQPQTAVPSNAASTPDVEKVPERMMS